MKHHSISSDDALTSPPPKGAKVYKGLCMNSVSRDAGRHVFPIIGDFGQYYHDHAKDNPLSNLMGECNTETEVPDAAPYRYETLSAPSPLRSVKAESFPKSNEPFPLKLHEMLETAEREGFTGVVSWQPHGRAFLVHNPRVFVDVIMPKYFRQTKFTSFQRQLNLYEFRRLTVRPDTGAYYHELFVRGKKFLCHKMRRIKIKGLQYKDLKTSEEPNLYQMDPLPPLSVEKQAEISAEAISFSTSSSLAIDQHSSQVANMASVQIEEGTVTTSVTNHPDIFFDTPCSSMEASPNFIVPDELFEITASSSVVTNPSAVPVTPTPCGRKMDCEWLSPSLEAYNLCLYSKDHAALRAMNQSPPPTLPSLNLSISQEEDWRRVNIEENETFCPFEAPRKHIRENSLVEFEGMKFHYLHPSDLHTAALQHKRTNDYGYDGSYVGENRVTNCIWNETLHTSGLPSGQDDRKFSDLTYQTLTLPAMASDKQSRNTPQIMSYTSSM